MHKYLIFGEERLDMNEFCFIKRLLGTLVEMDRKVIILYFCIKIHLASELLNIVCGFLAEIEKDNKPFIPKHFTQIDKIAKLIFFQ